jgi:hypothetical protein
MNTLLKPQLHKHSFIMRLLFSFYRKIAIKYIREHKKWYLEEANKKWEDKDYRRKCLENAIIYENTIMQITIESVTEDYNKTVLNAL